MHLPVETEAILEQASEYFRERSQDLTQRAALKGINPRFEIRIGSPAAQIVRLADEEQADAIVMGHRGGSLIQRWLLGSVAKRVLNYAHCTVVIVR